MKLVLRGSFLLTAAVSMLLLVLPWCDVLLGNVVPVLQALTPVWVVVAVVGFLGALLVRRRWAVLTWTPAFVLALAAGWLLTTSGGSPTDDQANGDRYLSVLSLNAEYGGAEPDAVMELIHERHPDVVVFVEMTAAKLAALDARGLRAVTPNRTVGMVDDGARGSVILSRWPLTTVDPDRHLGPFDLQEPVARIAAPGASTLVKAVHSYPPLQDGVAQWRPQLVRLGEWARHQPDDHLVMAGDYNASVANPAFRAVRSGLIDAVAQDRTAAWPTWPHGSWVPPFVQIDHILTRGFAPQAAGITSIQGTDHAAIWVTLRY